MLTDPMTATNDTMTKAQKLRERVIALLQERGWSQTKLAQKARLSPSTISKLIKGERRDYDWKTVESLAMALGVGTFDLTGERPPGVAEAPGEYAVARNDQVAVGRTEAAELLRLYVASPHFLEDNPTADELQWLAGLGMLVWTGSPPTAKTVSVILEQRRAGKI